MILEDRDQGGTIPLDLRHGKVFLRTKIHEEVCNLGNSQRRDGMSPPRTPSTVTLTDAGKGGKRTGAYTRRTDAPHVETALSSARTTEQSPRMKVQHVEVLVQTMEVGLSE